jgi:hypothetical protein
MVLNATFNNISVIWWQSVLLVDETRVPGENYRPVASHWQTLSQLIGYTHLYICMHKCLYGYHYISRSAKYSMKSLSSWYLDPFYQQSKLDLLLGPSWFELTTLVVIGTDCTGSWKPNYHTITTTMALTVSPVLTADRMDLNTNWKEISWLKYCWKWR